MTSRHAIEIDDGENEHPAKRSRTAAASVSQQDHELAALIAANEFDYSDDIEPTYEVEAVRDVRIVRGARQYRIKWVGFSERECTWESEEQLYDALDAIAVEL